MHTLLPYSSEIGGNFQTTFYMVDVGRLKNLFFNFYIPTCPRDLSVITKLLAQIFKKLSIVLRYYFAIM